MIACASGLINEGYASFAGDELIRPLIMLRAAGFLISASRLSLSVGGWDLIKDSFLFVRYQRAVGMTHLPANTRACKQTNSNMKAEDRLVYFLMNQTLNLNCF